MVGPIVTDARTVLLLAQHGPQAPPDHLIEVEEDARVGVLEVAEPAFERPVEIDHDDLQALPSGPPCLLADRLLQLVEALLSHMTTAAFEPVAEELEPVPLAPAVGDPRLLGVQHEAVRSHPRLDQRERRFGLRLVPGEDDEVVRIPHHRVSVFGHQPIEGIEINVGQQRADHRALRRAYVRRPPVQTLQDVGFQPTAEEVEHPAIADPLLDPRHQTIVRVRLEVRLQVGIHHMGVSLLEQPIDLPQRVTAPAFRTEAVAAVAEPALEDRLDHEPDRLLDDAILDRGYPQRPRPAVALRDLDPFDRLRAVAALPQGRRQLRQIDL